jgi:hypothetical protein
MRSGAERPGFATARQVRRMREGIGSLVVHA